MLSRAKRPGAGHGAAAAWQGLDQSHTVAAAGALVYVFTGFFLYSLCFVDGRRQLYGRSSCPATALRFCVSCDSCLSKKESQNVRTWKLKSVSSVVLCSFGLLLQSVSPLRVASVSQCLTTQSLTTHLQITRPSAGDAGRLHGWPRCRGDHLWRRRRHHRRDVGPQQRDAHRPRHGHRVRLFGQDRPSEARRAFLCLVWSASLFP